MADLTPESRYSATELISVDGVDTFGLYNPPAWIKNLNTSNLGNFSVTNDLERRPDLISKKLFGTPKFFWVLIQVNKPRDPLNWPLSGQVIKFPSSSIVNSNT